MHLLQAGVDITLIALWLGHESPTTTHRYVEADLAMKQRTLAKLQEPTQRRARFSPPDSLLAFLEGL
jgi:site-specific recombinase XerD